MSVYALYKSGLVAKFDAPPGEYIWLHRDRWPGVHLVYYLKCKCCQDQVKGMVPPHTRDHEEWIAVIPAADVLALGFGKPEVVALSGITRNEQQMLQGLADWFTRKQRHGTLPAKVEKMIAPLLRSITMNRITL